MNRRQFLNASLYASMFYGAGMLPRFVNEAQAGFAPLGNRVLVNLMMDGGPDLRHLIAPAWNAGSQTFGYKYWKNRWRAHRLANDSNAVLQQRWESDYYKVTVGGNNWSDNADSGGLNGGITFGIWKEAGWLIDMFTQGNVAIVCNAAGGRNRDHSLATKMMEQGNLNAEPNESEHSGWGGRLARQAGGSAVALTNVPREFCFGPDGNNFAAVDNKDLIAIQNSRRIGLYGFDPSRDRAYDTRQKMAGALQSYYAALKQENLATDVYEKFMDHETKVRGFGELMSARLDFPEPPLIRALHERNDANGNPHAINNDASGNSRRVLRNSDLGRQIRNLYDVMASNDLLNLRVASMSYGRWDSHENQRQPGNANDINDPDANRGIESNFKDIFGGPYADLPNALHGGFSALWQYLTQADKDKIVINMAGEFGRQIRDNGDRGTDHGKGNYMLLIGNGVTGGLYGELFPDTEIAKLDDSRIRTPDIDPKTDFDHIFGAACDWTAAASGNAVFPGRASNTNIETGVSLNNIFA